MTWYHPALAQRTVDAGDGEIKRLRNALSKIAGLAPEERVIPLDRAFATVREMASIARDALRT
jgi:hypothetical protein